MYLTHVATFLFMIIISTGIAHADSPVVVIKTSAGEIRVELNQEKAPITVENFLSYVDEGFYDGTIFHRVMDGFMIQGGGFAKGMTQKTTKLPIKNEAGNGLKNNRGAIAMARLPSVDSATSQFYINVADNASLNHQNNSSGGFGYAVFGRVIDGMDVVNQIKKVRTTMRNGMRDVPVDVIIIMSIRREK